MAGESTTYATFIGALVATVNAIHAGASQFSLMNGFTIEQRTTGGYYVEGEAWSFLIVQTASGLFEVQSV